MGNIFDAVDIMPKVGDTVKIISVRSADRTGKDFLENSVGRTMKVVELSANMFQATDERGPCWFQERHDSWVIL